MTSLPVFPIMVLDSDPSIEGGGDANAILIDRNNGIFVTNAHNVDMNGKYDTNQFHVYLPHTRSWHELEFNKNWVNWNCDVAFLRLNRDLSCYPEITRKTSDFKKWEDVRIVGYRSYDEVEAPQEIPCTVSTWRSHYGVTYPMVQTMWDAERRGTLGRAEQLVLYKNYIMLFIGKSELTPGMSGSAVIDGQDRLVGMVSSGGFAALAIPTGEYNEAAIERIMYSAPTVPPPPTGSGRFFEGLLRLFK